MFITHEVTLDIGFATARARLAELVAAGGLHCSSESAYDDGLATLIRVGPFGNVWGASKLVRVSFLEPVDRGDTVTQGLRWEATGPAGGLFPVLDADISITRAGEHSTALSLAGTYRPPLGRLGAGLDRMVLGQVATATVRSLLRCLSDALVNPGTEPELSSVR